MPDDIGPGQGQQLAYRATIANSGTTNDFTVPHATYQSTSVGPSCASTTTIQFTSTRPPRLAQHWHSQDNFLFHQHPCAIHGTQNSLDLIIDVNRSEMALSAPYQPSTGDSQRPNEEQETMRYQACLISGDWDWERFRHTMHGMYIKEGRSLKDLMKVMARCYNFKPT